MSKGECGISLVGCEDVRVQGGKGPGIAGDGAVNSRGTCKQRIHVHVARSVMVSTRLRSWSESVVLLAEV